MEIRIKRVYAQPDKHDGRRILVDRLWPRGLTKKKSSVDLWLKDIAPSTELREWFGHDRGRWEQFKERYLAELRGNREQIQLLKHEVEDFNGWIGWCLEKYQLRALFQDGRKTVEFAA